MLSCPKCGATLKLRMDLVPVAAAEAAPNAASAAPRPVEARQPSPKPASAVKPAEPESLGKSTWCAGVNTGRFPRPVKLGPRATAWRAEDIRKLIENGAAA